MRTRLTVVLDLDSPYKAVRLLRAFGTHPNERPEDLSAILTSASLVEAEFHDYDAAAKEAEE